MSDHTTEIPLKRCTGCGETKPATPEYFNRNKKGRYGLTQRCKMCISIAMKDYYQRKEDAIKLRQAMWRDANRERARQTSAAWYAANKEEAKRKNRMYRLTHPDLRGLERYHRRRARKHKLPYLWNELIELDMLDYWDFKCAYCGESLVGHRWHRDHYVAQSAAHCPGWVPWNMLPACESCNKSKAAKAPRSWLERRFGVRIAAKVMARIMAYFKYAERRAPVGTGALPVD